jgi:hypothetical protein
MRAQYALAAVAAVSALIYGAADPVTPGRTLPTR